MSRSLLLVADPRWVIARPPYRHRFPAPVRSWLDETGSLTARLEATGGPVRVIVLFEGGGRLMASERKHLGSIPGDPVWAREVLLEIHGVPMLLARTVAPRSTLRGEGAGFVRLGSRPLGELLFTHPAVVRGDTEWTRLEPRHWRMGKIGLPRWGRRTLYQVGGKPMLVNEFFLPAIFRLEQGDIG